MRLLLKILTLTIGIVFNVWGISSLLQTIGVFNLDALSYLLEIRLLYRYVVIIVTMIVGIMSLNGFAGLCNGKVKSALSITVCAYSTVLTLPLLFSFVMFFIAKAGIATVAVIDDMVMPIYNELISIFTTDVWQYVIFSGGVLMSLIFLAVPIIMCRSTVKGKSKRK